jgi:hypothetical protein
LRKEHRLRVLENRVLRVLENRVLRKIFGPNDEVSESREEFFMIFTAHQTLIG